MQQPAAVVRPAPAGWGWAAPVCQIFWLVFLSVLLCGLTPGLAAEPSSDLTSKPVAAEPDSPSKPTAAADKGTAQTNVLSLEGALKMQTQRFAKGLQVTPPPPPNHNLLILTVASLLAAGLALRIFTARLDRKLDAPAPLSASAEEDALRAKLMVEDPTMAEFFDALREGLQTSFIRKATKAVVPAGGSGDEAGAEAARVAAETLRAFFAAAPAEIGRLRTLFGDINRTADEAARLKLLVELSEQVRPPQEFSELPALRPIWLMASALEGLLMQMSCKASNATPSVLRTAARALDMMENLCVPGLKADLATEPPVRILAVDDDAVCRRSISLALKKVFNEPDLAPEGQAALALVAQRPYDVIFLDIDMPGMDGFELCTKIRDAGLNRTTPVVFVTRHSDFNSRAQSSLSGGQDLIAKPYLPFEIVVKALTLALSGRLQRGRLEASLPVKAAPDRKASGKAAAASKTATATAPSPRPAAATTTAGAELNKERRLRKKRKHQFGARESSPLRALPAVTR